MIPHRLLTAILNLVKPHEFEDGDTWRDRWKELQGTDPIAAFSRTLSGLDDEEKQNLKRE